MPIQQNIDSTVLFLYNGLGLRLSAPRCTFNSMFSNTALNLDVDFLMSFFALVEAGH